MVIWDINLDKGLLEDSIWINDNENQVFSGLVAMGTHDVDCEDNGIRKAVIG